MKFLFVPKPILDDKMAVKSYCIRYRRADKYLSNQPLWELDGAMNSPCLDLVEMVGLVGLSNGLPIFVPVSKFNLLIDIETHTTVPPEKLIFLLDNQMTAEESVIDNIKRLKALGFGFAIEKVSDYEAMAPVLGLCDFLFINSKTENFRDLIRTLRRSYRNLSLIASKVDDTDTFLKIRRNTYDMFEGKFYSKPIMQAHNTITPIKVNRIQLLNVVRNEEFDIDEVVKVVGQDPSLSISLLKFVNSPYLGISQKIQTIQHAVAMLGQTEVRKWVTTATSGALGDDKPDEVTKLSLIRARFAENLAGFFEMAIHSSGLFLMGLFSVLDVILEMPMDKALEIVTVSDPIYKALALNQGDYANVLNFIFAYETGNWNEVNRILILKNISVENVTNAYIEAAKWYSSIITATDAGETESGEPS